MVNFWLVIGIIIWGIVLFYFFHDMYKKNRKPKKLNIKKGYPWVWEDDDDPPPMNPAIA